VAETIENNLRRTIIDQSPINPKYYDRMSELLDALIEQRRQQALSYQDYLEQVKQLARQVKPHRTADTGQYPAAMDTPGKRSLYDNLDQNEALVLKIDTAVRYTKKPTGSATSSKSGKWPTPCGKSPGYTVDLKQVMDLLKNQDEYQ
jgi:type I restriction enzyme R subunit